ncbi:expressed unknown protein [Seminavis robusta]|uniref:SAP domain-containing protein n=1 Tax=Seminavis robusta TaxID=568900 RepID=A0A9N8H7E1_9STRA|nr:expressed unknown protein [Seminavis robusta]|eukprot:Sro126_g060530.1 n/a (730) ;mRNA; f:38504-40892
MWRLQWIVGSLLWVPSYGFLLDPLPRKTSLSRQLHHPSNRLPPRDGTTSTTSSTSTQLLENKLWDRLEIEEDPEPFWYLINCVAGLELDLLAQCRQATEDMPDAIFFCAPTETKTRSHGANRMVTESKVKYQGYVFGKLRLCPEVYEAIQGLDLCRSWMGTVNHKGYKKLPPLPVALNEMEVENFGLEELEKESQQQDDEQPPQFTEQGEDVILDDADTVDPNAIDEDALKVFLGLRVNDMVKVTQRGKFYDEDATVRRLKDGKILCRFFTYGTMYEEWMNPGDVRKLSDREVVKGLSGPDRPITQYDIDGGKGKDGRGGGRQSTRTFGDNRGDLMDSVRGGAGLRNRRQDRTERGQNQRRDFFGRTAEDRKQEDRNWDWYKEQQRSKEGMVSDDEFTYRPGSRGRDNNNDNAANARPPSQRQQRRERKPQQQDWSAYVSSSPSSSPRSQEDDFFASLMNDLSKDANNNNNNKADDNDSYNQNNNNNNQQAAQEEDDFFASLVAEISNEDDDGHDNGDNIDNRRNRNKNPKETPSSLSTDDFFASLAASNSDEQTDHSSSVFDEDDLFSNKKSSSSEASDDDFFASLEKELGGALGATDDDSSSKGSDNREDFFASLESTLTDTSGEDDSDDFFASLGETLSVELQGDDDTQQSSTDQYSAEEESIPTQKQSTATAQPEVVKSPAPSSSGAATSTDLSKLTVPKLKEMLKARGLKVSGKKAELIERLSA